MLSCYHGTITPCYGYHVTSTILSYYHINPATIWPSYHAIMLPQYQVTMIRLPCYLPCDNEILLPCDQAIILPCYNVTTVPCHHVTSTMLLCYFYYVHVAMPLCYHVTRSIDKMLPTTFQMLLVTKSDKNVTTIFPVKVGWAATFMCSSWALVVVFLCICTFPRFQTLRIS